jgi:hypothetical protein
VLPESAPIRFEADVSLVGPGANHIEVGFVEVLRLRARWDAEYTDNQKRYGILRRGLPQRSPGPGWHRPQFATAFLQGQSGTIAVIDSLSAPWELFNPSGNALERGVHVLTFDMYIAAITDEAPHIFNPRAATRWAFKSQVEAVYVDDVLQLPVTGETVLSNPPVFTVFRGRVAGAPFTRIAGTPEIDLRPGSGLEFSPFPQ